MEASDSLRIRRAALQKLESLQRAGVTQLPKAAVAVSDISLAMPPTVVPAPRASLMSSPPAPSPPTSPVFAAPPMPPAKPAAPKPSPPVISSPASSASSSGANLQHDERHAALQVIRDEVAACTCCDALVRNRTQTVFGVGNLQPRLCFFGEAPGADEDKQGEPFVGRAGQLLDKIIEAMTLKRSEVYILNVLKCRPPDNRPPADDEVANCRHFFERQLRVLRPEFICCLGASSAKALLQTTLSIGKLRGKFHDLGSAKVIATYHPAYLLRNPSAKKDVWEDMKLLMKAMGIAVQK